MNLVPILSLLAATLASVPPPDVEAAYSPLSSSAGLANGLLDGCNDVVWARVEQLNQRHQDALARMADGYGREAGSGGQIVLVEAAKCPTLVEQIAVQKRYGFDLGRLETALTQARTE